MDKNLRTSWKIYLLAFLFAVGTISFLAPPVADAGYNQTNLVSNEPGLANFTDPNLVNPWGISSSSTSPFWVSDNGSGVATLYNGAGQLFPVGNPLVVTIPPPVGAQPPSTPTGVVFNVSSDFGAARFIFGSERGTISGWTSGTTATLQVDNSAGGAVYTGLALGNIGSANFLYAANFSAGTINAFDGNFSPVSLAGSFSDPNIPSGYAPFNVKNLAGNLFVTYAMQDGTTHDDIAGPGKGFVDIFDLNGNLLRRLISNGPLNSPWGLALAPAQFSEFSNDLLVGNSGDGRIDAFDPMSGAFLGALEDSMGNPIAIDGLRGLIFGNGGSGGDFNTLYFTAGPDQDQHGLFGSLAPDSSPVPEPSTLLLLSLGLVGLTAYRNKFKKA